MVNEFNPSWINVIGEIMMEWYNNFPLYLFVSGANHTILVMRAIQYAVVLPQFCVGRRLLRGRIYRNSWDQRSLRILEEPLDLYFGCVSLYFLQANLFLWTVVLVFQICLLRFWIRGCMPALSSRSVGIGRKVFQGISLTCFFLDNKVGGVDTVEVAIEYGKPFSIFYFKDPGCVMKLWHHGRLLVSWRWQIRSATTKVGVVSPQWKFSNIGIYSDCTFSTISR